MKNRLLMCLLLCLPIMPAQAEWLFGVKTGPMSVSVDNGDVGDDPVNLGVMIGYELGILAGDLAIEAEITRSTSSGTLNGQDLDVESNGLYLSYTTPGPLYFKVKGGLMDAKLEAAAAGQSEDESGETYGFGVGLSAGLVRIELEYTAIDDDINFISVGVVF